MPVLSPSTETTTFVINPYIAGSPVKDADMFFGREDVYAWLRQHLRGAYQDNAIVLYGERRSGKTSILYQMKEGLGDKRYVPVLLDLQGMALEGMDGFLWEVARKIVMALRGIEGVPLLDRPARQDFEENPRHQFEEVFLLPVIAALGERRLLLMFDEADRLGEKVQSGDLPADVFDYLRALIQQVSRLNFLFALGKRIEVTNRSSSQLFNLAVYRKISFLEPDFAEDLITKPVAQYYTYTRPAIERILRLTSGQPYYTQLLCHNLFTRWAENRPAQLDVGDVEAVLPSAIEQGTPNLQYTWEDSTPVEQAILAALAQAAPHHSAGVLRRNLERTLRKANLYPPEGEVTKGLKNLFERDILNNQEPYDFRVGLMPQWINKFKRLDWVRQELGQVAEEWEQLEQQRRAKAPTPFERALSWAVPALAILLAGVIIISVTLYQRLQGTTDAYVATVTVLAATMAANSTQVAESQIALVMAGTKQAEAESKGNRQEAADTRATADALASTATAIAATATWVVGEAAAIAQQAAIPTQTEAATPTPVIPTSTSTPLPTATDTATVIPSPTPQPTFTPIPVAGPRGRLAIPVDNGGRYDVHIYAVPAGNLLGQIPGARQPSFRDSDSKLAVNQQGGLGETIWVYEADGLSGQPVTLHSSDSHPSWSPDGQSLVYDNPQLFGKDGQNVWRIFIQHIFDRPVSSEVERLDGDILDASSPLYPVWAANDQIIFYACNYWIIGGSGQCGIWRTSPTATDKGSGFRQPQVVTTNSEIPTDTYGNSLLMMGTASGNWEVYLGTVDGGPLQNLSNNQANDGLATFSPDGRWVAFMSSRGGSWGVWIMPVTGGEAVRLPVDNLQFGGGDRNWTTERISWGFDSRR